MAPQYAKDQPAGFRNRIEKIAIVGAGGQVGKYITTELLAQGEHTVTAITRPDSNSSLPNGVHTVQVDYSDPSSLVAALKGQDALIVTMAVTAPPDTQSKLIAAAAEAGVPWIMPNEFGIGSADEALGRDVLLGPRLQGFRDEIEKAGVSNWVSLVCGFWYEFSLAGSIARYGFDFPNRKVEFKDDGNTKINTSTWPQCGKAVARLFALKLLPEDENDKEATLSEFKNSFCYISSFLISQKDMFESIKRVTGTNDEDWEISYRPSKTLYEEGVERFKTGDVVGFGMLLYNRVFYPDGSGDYEAKHKLHNDMLGLPKEDLDEWTKVAVDMAKEQT